MMKYRVTTTVDFYWDVIVEAEDELEARNWAAIDFDNSLDSLRPYIEVTEVPEDTELGDVE
jgi:hypothetical protein